MEGITGRAGELCERLVNLVNRPDAQLRAVATTLLIKALDVPGEELTLIEAMVASDQAAFMIDPSAAGAAGLALRHGLGFRLDELSLQYGEVAVVRTMRDHLTAQIERWASRAVDDADSRRRVERFLAWAERPGQLEAAQRRGLFLGLDSEEFRRLAGTQVAGPVTPETALGVWTQFDRWVATVEERLGDPVLAAWVAAATGS
jgi:hypothetical protein